MLRIPPQPSLHRMNFDPAVGPWNDNVETLHVEYPVQSRSESPVAAYCLTGRR